MFNLRSSFGSSSDDNMVGGGVSIALNKAGSNGLTKQALIKKVDSLEKENAQIKQVLNKVVNKLNGLTLNPNAKEGFTDVPQGHWANDAVSTLHGNGFVQGYPDGKFHGDRLMTRYEYAKMLHDALAKGLEVDKNQLAEYAPELEQIKQNEVLEKIKQAEKMYQK